MTPEKLLPCPFCGAALVKRGNYNKEGGWNWLQHEKESACIIANVKVPSVWSSAQTGIARWNRRSASTTREAALREAAAAALNFLCTTNGAIALETRDTILSLLTHPPAAQEAKEAAWQPIETAPKDGRRVDLWFPSSGRAADWQWETGGIIGRSGGMWVKRYPEAAGYEIALETRPNDHPTYWMIVSPPHAAADKAEGGGA